MTGEQSALRNLAILYCVGIGLLVINWGICVKTYGSKECKTELDNTGAAVGAAVSTYLAFLYKKRRDDDDDPASPSQQPAVQAPGWPTRPLQAPQEQALTPQAGLVEAGGGGEASGAVLGAEGDWRGR